MIIEVIQEDITKLEVDAIVNAANSSLMGGGGVDGAIHHAGGTQILEECKQIRDAKGGCPPGEAVITSGGNLKARFVIHTVGPIWKGGRENEDKILTDAYRNSLRLAVETGITTIAFPNISTGVYGFPKEKAAGIAVNTVKSFSLANGVVTKVVFCCFDDENFKLYKTRLK